MSSRIVLAIFFLQAHCSCLFAQKISGYSALAPIKTFISDKHFDIDNIKAEPYSTHAINDRLIVVQKDNRWLLFNIDSGKALPGTGSFSRIWDYYVKDIKNPDNVISVIAEQETNRKDTYALIRYTFTGKNGSYTGFADTLDSKKIFLSERTLLKYDDFGAIVIKSPDEKSGYLKYDNEDLTKPIVVNGVKDVGPANKNGYCIVSMQDNSINIYSLSPEPILLLKPNYYNKVTFISDGSCIGINNNKKPEFISLKREKDQTGDEYDQVCLLENEYSPQRDLLVASRNDELIILKKSGAPVQKLKFQKRIDAIQCRDNTTVYVYSDQQWSEYIINSNDTLDTVQVYKTKGDLDFYPLKNHFVFVAINGKIVLKNIKIPKDYPSKVEIEKVRIIKLYVSYNSQYYYRLEITTPDGNLHYYLLTLDGNKTEISESTSLGDAVLFYEHYSVARTSEGCKLVDLARKDNVLLDKATTILDPFLTTQNTLRFTYYKSFNGIEQQYFFPVTEGLKSNEGKKAHSNSKTTKPKTK